MQFGKEKNLLRKTLLTSGIKTVYWLSEFESIFKQLMAEADKVYINTNEHSRANTEVETREDRFIKKLKQDFPSHHYLKAAPIMHRVRSIKGPEEIDLMQNACRITEKGFKRLLKFIKPGVWEYEIEAELMHEFLINRSRGFLTPQLLPQEKCLCTSLY